MTPPDLDPSCQEALYEVDGGAYIASFGLYEVNHTFPKRVTMMKWRDKLHPINVLML